MLVLTRRIDESISIGGDVTVRVLRVNGGRVRIGISAPRTVEVQRTELAMGPSSALVSRAAVPAMRG